MISTVGIDVDWKEKFFVLAVLVNGAEWEDAKKFVSTTLRQPTMLAVDETICTCEKGFPDPRVSGFCGNCHKPFRH